MATKSPTANSVDHGRVGEVVNPNRNPESDITATTKNGEERINRLESIVAQQTATISDLVNEIQETNRWMKRLLSDKSPEVIEEIPAAEDVGPPNTVSGLPEAGELVGEISDRIPPTTEQRRMVVQQLVENYLFNPENNEFVADAWRREFLRHLWCPTRSDGLGEEGSVVAKATDFKFLSGTETLQISWNPLSEWVMRTLRHKEKLMVKAMQDHLDNWWPRGSAAIFAPHDYLFNEFDDPWCWRVITGRIAGRLAGSLFLHGAGERLVHALLGIDTQWDWNEELTTEACVGALWSLIVIYDRIDLHLTSQMVPYVFSQREPLTPMLPPGDSHLRLFVWFLSNFASGWDQHLSNFPSTVFEPVMSPLEDSTYISHTIQIFSV